MAKKCHFAIVEKTSFGKCEMNPGPLDSKQ